MLSRKKIIRAVEKILFRLDTTKYLIDSPKTDYHPLPWVGIQTARRAEGVKERLQMIEKFLKDRKIKPAVVMDIGCNAGYFSLSFVERNMFVYAVEVHAKWLRLAQYARRKIHSKGTLVPINILITPQNVRCLPNSDLTLCFSVWHHWVRQYDLDAATKMLRTIWDKTDKVLFFETGEQRIDFPELPFDTTPREWLIDYLNEVCVGGKVEFQGESKSPVPRVKNAAAGEVQVGRSVFTIVRNVESPLETANSDSEKVIMAVVAE